MAKKRSKRGKPRPQRSVTKPSRRPSRKAKHRKSPAAKVTGEAAAGKRPAVAYLRVSTDRQAEGDSLEAQLAAAKKFAAGRGLRLAAHFSDSGKSGRSRKGRSALEEALAKVRACKGVLIVRSLSRLARSVIDLHEITRQLERHGASLASINEAIDTSTAAGRAFFGFVAVMAQFESDLIGERVREAYAHRKAIGKPILAGVPQFGWRVVRGELVEHVEAQQTLRMICKRYRAGDSYKQIADWLNEHGRKTGDQLYGRRRPGIKKARWWRGSVHRVVQRLIAEGDLPRRK